MVAFGIKIDPTTSVWAVAKYFTASVVLVLIPVCLKNFNSEEDGILTKIRRWSPEKKTQLLSTYFYLVLSSLMMCTAVAIGSNNSFIAQKMAAMFPTYAVGMSILGTNLLLMLLRRVPNSPGNSVCRHIAWILQSIVMTPCFLYLGTEICLKAAVAVVAAVVLGNCLALTVSTEFKNYLEERISYAYIITNISTFWSLFSTPPSNTMNFLFLTTNLYGGILLYFFLNIIHVQNALEKINNNDHDPLRSSSDMFVSILNMYHRIALLFVVGDSTVLPHIRGHTLLL